MREVMVLAQAEHSLRSAYTSIRVWRVDPHYRSANRELARSALTLDRFRAFAHHKITFGALK